MANDVHPRVQHLVKQDRGIFDTFNLTLHSAIDGVCVLEGVVPRTLVNAAGFAHGSFTYSMMDTGCAYALASLEKRGVTINGSVNYVRGGSAGSRFVATVSVVNAGRRIATFDARVEVELEGEMKLASHGTFVFQIIKVASES